MGASKFLAALAPAWVLPLACAGGLEPGLCRAEGDCVVPEESVRPDLLQLGLQIVPGLLQADAAAASISRDNATAANASKWPDVGGIAGRVNDAVDKVNDAVDKVNDTVSKVKDTVSEGLSNATQSLSNITSGLSNELVGTLINALNSTLKMLQSQADSFLVESQEYKDKLMQSAAASSDLAIVRVQATVKEGIQPLQRRWSQLTDAITLALPPISAALEALGLKDVAGPVTDVVEQATTSINGVLNNATEIIAGLNDTSQEQQELVLARLNTTIARGLTAVDSFAQRLEDILQGMIASLAKQLGITLPEKDSQNSKQAASGLEGRLAALQHQIAVLVDTLDESLNTIFRGTLDAVRAPVAAAKKAVATEESGSQTQLAYAAVDLLAIVQLLSWL